MASRNNIPVDKKIDNSLALLFEGYKFIPNRCRRFQSDIFQTRLLGGRKVICISGEEAARLFYDSEKFKRKGAAPKRIQESLFGKKGVQTLDGDAHKHRKQLFMALMTPERLKLLAEITTEQWEIACRRWVKGGKVVLFNEAREIMCRVACQWVGVPLKEGEVKQRANDLGDMIDAFGAIGPRHWEGRTARNRSEKWISEIIRKVRSEKLTAPRNSALFAFAWHRDLDGNFLDTPIATVELLNIIRPIVAIARYVVFGALALHDNPDSRQKLEADEGKNYSQLFVQEVRRFYPFGPFLGAKVRKDFIWNGCAFRKGTLVLLDIYGTNHDPRVWGNPNEFKPERFNDWKGSPFDFIPQGGGDYQGHRCAGEWVTIEVMKKSLGFLTRQMDYTVPDQDLSINTVRMPAIPKSRFVIAGVKKKT